MGVFVANRGEIAVRIVRAAREAGLEAVVAVTRAEADGLAARLASGVHVLPGEGPAAYLDAAALVAGAREHGCTLLHPGYGFLSESPELARACADADVTFVGPDAGLLELFGDKGRARAAAQEAGVPVLPATDVGASVAEVEDFARAQLPGGVMIKAAAGGGGRGMRAVPAGEPVAPAVERARSEAERSFGSGDLFAELYVERARHVEVQVAADGEGGVTHLGERDCTLQRRFQKVVEVAPAPDLPDDVRAALHEAAVRLLVGRGYRGLATVEFLLDADDPTRWWFIEVNPRLQVEHPVTELVTGVDLVLTQLALATGRTLGDLGLADPPAVRGSAVELRVTAERVGSDGALLPAHGVATGLTWPSGPGVRVDTHLVEGARVDGAFDSLVAKVVTHSHGGLAGALDKARRAALECSIDGVETTLPLLRELLAHDDLARWQVTTGWIESSGVLATVDAGGSADDTAPGEVRAEMTGTVLEVLVGAGDEVALGAPLLVVEAMKMEHVVTAPAPGTVTEVRSRPGATTAAGDLLVRLLPSSVGEEAAAVDEGPDLDAERADLTRLRERQERRLDAARPEAVARRHARGQRTARDNLADLLDEGSLVEYGGLAVAAQRARRTEEELVATTPADGIVTGIGRVTTAPGTSPRVAVLAYDYTVLAGTQGYLNHKKTDRMLEIAEQQRLPVVLFAEGGGGRPGDTDTTVASGLDVPTFATMGRLSGLVPTIGIAAGRCFAGNAALLGCCDVIIATRDSTIGMGGPAMIEGGGLGVFAPEEVGPIEVQGGNGVVDVVVDDEAEAVAVAQRYLGYFQGRREEWSAPDQRHLRHVVPESRVRAYDVRRAIDTLADEGSVLELRAGFAPGVITALVRIEGRPMGLVANNPRHLGGAIDSPAADKLARFLQLCDAHGLPVVSLCDTPGFMVGPDHERTATVRHFARLFVIGAHLRVPVVTVVLRKAYGLGAQAMAAGGFHRPAATLAWPTGEVGGMGLEGAVRLGFRRELEAVADPTERAELEAQLLAQMYERGRAVNAAAVVELDDVIDPVDTRQWITTALGEVDHTDVPRGYVDTW
ncbi:acetyl-CoA carboxylase family protein [Janibacter hoylei]|uniref:Carbamoyl-phosphate synthase large subunit n=1 Tax=Janibacter hoylei PVAS-1 TaxID=1210046 RepID=A0A444B2E8_9MICO|nr:carboxyl transferase domain-containing protein [Janibacter hoylei]MCT1618482.1 carbamoyl-phosphate synthase large subunit [Janibacter hoylei]MCT2293401.1 carbamoyl-phosphate synthase large subunit [Janibacter hoylei]RWU82521.1 carbamoyl-phosphate synthase large subunit [Janibacter hoylei PVAS-1]